MKRIAAVLLSAAAVAARAELPSAADEEAALAAARAYATAALRGDYAGIYRSFPAAWRERAAELARTVAPRMDAEVWEAGRAALRKAATVAALRARWLFDAVNEDHFDGGLDPDVDMPWLSLFARKTGGIADGASIASFAAGNWEALLGAPPLDVPGAPKPSGPPRLPDLAAKGKEDGSVEVLAPGTEFHGLVFLRFEGRWVPEWTVSFFEEDVKDLLEDARNLDPPEVWKKKALGIAGILSDTADAAGRAETAEAFEEVLNQGTLLLTLAWHGAEIVPADEDADW